MRRHLAGLIGVALSACAHANHRVQPDPHRSATGGCLDASSCDCLERTGRIPPHPFATDGCSVFPDDGWVHCCVAHDEEYWCGGSAEARSQADHRLEQCVANLDHPAIACVMHLGVRVGGAAWLPFPWRWGFGWDYPDDGDPGERPR
jgi:hypothetical protein